jgi:EAL domain-containing protein (putative c-di-GMP-specific phosphodiesterase class I)
LIQINPQGILPAQLALSRKLTRTIETREQFEMLRTLGVNFAQGYLLGRPVPINELESQIRPGRSHQDAA